MLDDNSSHYILMHFSSNFIKIAFIKTKTAILGKQAKCTLRYVRLCFYNNWFFFFTLIDYCFLLESSAVWFSISDFGSLKQLIHCVRPSCPFSIRFSETSLGYLQAFTLVLTALALMISLPIYLTDIHHCTRTPSFSGILVFI